MIPRGICKETNEAASNILNMCPKLTTNNYLKAHCNVANFSLIFVCNRRSVQPQSWRMLKLLLFLQSRKYNFDLPCVMSLHLVIHLPMLVAMAAKFLMCE